MPISYKQIIAAHPLPWSYHTLAMSPAQIVVVDAVGKNVELFTLLDFAMLVGQGIARTQESAATDPTVS